MSRIFRIHMINVEKFNDLLDKYYYAINVSSIAPDGAGLFVAVQLKQNAAFEDMYEFSNEALKLRSA